MNLLKPIDALVDDLTMYRLVLYYLIGLLLAAAGLCVVGDLRYDVVELVGSTLLLVAVCWLSNKFFAHIFRAPTNSESSLITGLILALIITPEFSVLGIAFLVIVSMLAMASKYVLAINRKHIFNPAAIAVVLTAIGPNQTASWWVGSSVMLPFVVIGGLLLARKLRETPLLLCFFGFTALVSVMWALPGGGQASDAVRHAVLNSPMFFLGFVMLTEPLTAPTRKIWQVIYGGIVGFLLPPQAHLLNFYTSPEIALIVGNVFAYIVTPKVKLFPTLKERLKIAANTADFAFTSGKRLKYEPGQYIEMTLPHAHTDDRGDRRYFTLASSPTETEIHVGVKFYNPGSSFKKAMLVMDESTPVVIARVSGEFTLPRNTDRKLAFIAGGIGITPFRSMTKYMIDTNEHRDVVLLYGAKTQQDVAYGSIFEEARKKLNMRTIYALSDDSTTSNQPDIYNGRVDEQLLRLQVPDYKERIFYISGTHPMVHDMKRTLRRLGISRRNVKTDFFPGYV